VPAQPPPKRSGGFRGTGLGTSVLSGVIAAVFGIVLIIVGSVLNNHFGPANSLCNTLGGQIAQQGSTGTTVSCTGDEFGAVMGEILKWLGFAALIVGVLSAVAIGIKGSRSRQQRSTPPPRLVPGGSSPSTVPSTTPSKDVGSICHNCGATFPRSYTGHACLECGATLEIVR
jgi:hypothetical protein